MTLWKRENGIQIWKGLKGIVKLGVVVALIVAATTTQQYSYYTFLRWLVMISFIYFAYVSFSRKEIGLLIFFASTAVLFNPFVKFWFQKETWHLIDYIVSAITLVSIYFDWTSNKKRTT